MALLSVKLIFTLKPSATSLSRLTVYTISPPSVTVTSSTNNVAVSSSLIVPMAVSLSSTRVDEEARFTINVSSDSNTASSMVDKVTVCCSPAVPEKLIV